MFYSAHNSAARCYDVTAPGPTLQCDESRKNTECTCGSQQISAAEGLMINGDGCVKHHLQTTII